MRAGLRLALAAALLFVAPGCGRDERGSAPPARNEPTVPARLAPEVERLRDGGDAAADALGRLVAAGPDGVAALLAALRSDEAAVRRLAAEGLGLAADPKAGDALALAVEDSDGLVRAHAATALARLDDPRAVPALVRTFDDAPDPLHADLTLSAETMISLGPRAVRPLVDLLDAASEPARARALLVLQKIASDRFDDIEAAVWADLHDRLGRYRPDAGAADRAGAVDAVRAWLRAHPSLVP